MAYNPLFPTGYQPFYPQPQQTQPQQTGRIYVTGETGAKSYLVAPNTSVTLWDSEDSVIYIKSADASGMPSMRILDYTERTAEMSQPSADYATKDDLKALRSEIETLKESVRREKADV